MQPISAIASPTGSSFTGPRRRDEAPEASPTRDPPPVANFAGDSGRPILPAPAAYGAGALAEGPPPDPTLESAAAKPTSAAREAADPNNDAAAADAGPGPSQAARDAKAADDAPKSARLEVVDVQGRLGAPIAVYDNSSTPPTLVLYV